MAQPDPEEPKVTTGELDQELVKLLAEAEATVERLNGEIRRRQQDESEIAQHAEIDRLAEHLQKAQINWQQVFEFFESAILRQRASDEGKPEADQ